MESNQTEMTIPLPNMQEEQPPQVQHRQEQEDDDDEYTPTPTGKRRKVADTIDQGLLNNIYVDTGAMVGGPVRTRPPRWTVPMNDKLKQFYAEFSVDNKPKKLVWEEVAEKMRQTFQYYDFDSKYCHNHYHYCTKLNDHLGDEADDVDATALIETVAKYGDHDGAWFKIALEMRQKTGKLRGAKDLQAWYNSIKASGLSAVDDHSAHLLAQVQQAAESHADQVSHEILSSITAALASVEGEAAAAAAATSTGAVAGEQENGANGSNVEALAAAANDASAADEQQ